MTAQAAKARTDRKDAKPLKGFMVPSVFGDEPPLANLRRDVRDELTLEVLALPDTHARGRLLSDMAATGRVLTQEILDRQPTGPVAVVGFSFGASLALEVAGQLERAGRRVSFLGILDGPFDPPEMPKPGAAPRRSTVRRLFKPVAVGLIERSAVVRRIASHWRKNGTPQADPAEPMRRAILWHLRSKALTSWVPGGCSAPGLHITTGDYGAANRARWAELCPNLRHAEIRVRHEDLLKGEALRELSHRLTEAVRHSR